ncbi:sodium:alanine symporter family protein [uncultured Phascolarctobacterium sp.]|uniref:alanine/glycine:cation symporter family protein n=1 Tax=uncultured Phascolarctobacterium sp. TaxID=512296 RepID=UPI0026313AFF|nr:sodium:alanine symporter family protein [uncultured Phascolarctobacterium sp.]
MVDFLNAFDSFVWGPPLMILLIGTGIMLTLRLGLLQVTKLPMALKLIFSARSNGSGDVSSFQALCTALAATVGTGNIVGVATAVKAGGPGALFWMWIAAFFGMATKYAECLLAVKYRQVDADGNVSGGPMYYIEQGLGKSYKPLAVMFAVFGVMTACLGTGTFTQVNSITSIVNVSFDVPEVYTAIVLTLLVAATTIGGLKSIANVASKIVPFMAVLYVVCSVAVLIYYADAIPAAVKLVIDSAFTTTAATGGFLGASVMLAMRSGVARGIFSNEAGLGSAPIVAAAAKTKWAAEQGLVSMTGTFIDTIIICTMTGLTLVASGVWCGDLNGAAMTEAAFAGAFPVVAKYMLTAGLVLFAFTTIIGWNYYGERCVEYLCGVKGIMPYRIAYIILVGLGAFLKLEVIWIIADIVNGLMAFPNLIALVGLSGVVVAESKRYFDYLSKRQDRKNNIKSIRNNSANA